MDSATEIMTQKLSPLVDVALKSKVSLPITMRIPASNALMDVLRHGYKAFSPFAIEEFCQRSERLYVVLSRLSYMHCEHQ